MVDDLGAALLHDHAAVHEHDLIGDLAREADLMGDDHHRHAFLGEGQHDVEHLAHQFGIERGRRLVEQHDLRLHRQRACDGDALLLATGKLRRVVVETFAHAHALELGDGAFAGLLLVHVLHVDRRLHHIFEGRHVREQVEALEHHAELRTLRRHFLVVEGLEHLPAVLLDVLVADHLAVHVDFAAGQRLQLVDQTQERGLAGTGRPENHRHRSRHHRHIDALEHMQVAERLVHLGGLHRGNDAG